jgi:hypothetical protein
VARAFLSVAVLAACAHAPAALAPPPRDPGAAFLEDPRPKHFHSSRFELTVPLPDGPAWRIDDHHSPFLEATHAATESTLTLGIWGEADLMSRQKCEASAREKGLVHDDEMQTVADEVVVGPAQYDSHVVVLAVPSPTPHQVTAGHAFLFGGFLRKCLFVHYATRQRPGEDEMTLSSRLAVARLQILGGIRIEAFDKVPEEKRP